MSDSSDDAASDLSDDFSDNEEMEVLPSEEESDDDMEHFNNLDRFQIELKKDEMASDIEDDIEEDYLPNSQAWGGDKRNFYHTDYVDKDFRSQKHKDDDLAKYEEEEALAIQKRLLDSVDENDLGLDLLIDYKVKTKKDDKVEPISEKKSSFILDINTLTDFQKNHMLQKESPELELLISDFKKYIFEIKNELEPLQSALRSNNSKLTSGFHYLKLRHSLLTNYCTNISFYLTMKCSSDKQIVKDHPIVKQLFLHKTIISKLDDLKLNDKFSKELESLSNMVKENRKINFVDDVPEMISDDVDVELQIDEVDNIDNNLQDVEDIYSEMNEDEKRAITYEMEKNKGLTPKRKKEQRNPRVKYRKKFENAVVRRKGQVRKPRKEIKKYSGEVTGINVRAVKSVKFK